VITSDRRQITDHCWLSPCLPKKLEGAKRYGRTQVLDRVAGSVRLCGDAAAFADINAFLAARLAEPQTVVNRASNRV
jgi:hypothetical protein